MQTLVKAAKIHQDDHLKAQRSVLGKELMNIVFRSGKFLDAVDLQDALEDITSNERRQGESMDIAGVDDKLHMLVATLASFVDFMLHCGDVEL